MIVSVVTCTGFRPEALALCQKFIESQTYKGKIQWIVIKDENTPNTLKSSKRNITIEEYLGPKMWEPDYNTHRGNMELAMKKVAGEYLFIFEDDDYYAPEYIETNLDILQHVYAVGHTNAKYFHIKLPGWKELHNYRHASLASTGLSKWGYPFMLQAINSGDLYFDRVLWGTLIEKKKPIALIDELNISVGMKGMPGRDGITPSHRELRDYFLDHSLLKLKEWIGEDYKLYEPYTKKGLKNGNKKADNAKIVLREDSRNANFDSEKINSLLQTLQKTGITKDVR